jgi:hypothetical protein
MSTPVPEVFKIFSLHRYFISSIEMREHYREVGKQFSPTPSFFDSEDAGRAFMYLSYWYAGLFVVCEGWQDLKLADSEIDGLLASSNLELLKRFRNGVYHYQPDYFDKRLTNPFVLGKDFDDWVESLTHAFARYLDAWTRSQTAPLDQPS